MNKSGILRAFKAENREFINHYAYEESRYLRYPGHERYDLVRKLRGQVKQLNGTFRRQLRLTPDNYAESIVIQFKSNQQLLFERYERYISALAGGQSA